MAGDGDGYVGRWLCIENNGERGGAAGFCGEEISAISGAGLGDGDALWIDI